MQRRRRLHERIELRSRGTGEEAVGRVRDVELRQLTQVRLTQRRFTHVGGTHLRQQHWHRQEAAQARRQQQEHGNIGRSACRRFIHERLGASAQNERLAQGNSRVKRGRHHKPSPENGAAPTMSNECCARGGGSEPCSS